MGFISKETLGDINKLSESDYDYLCPLEYSETGLKDVVLWVGSNPENNCNIVKVSNIPNDRSGHDTFVVNLDNMDVVGNKENNFINSCIENIISFLRKNKEIIIEYSNSDTMSTKQMVDKFVL